MRKRSVATSFVLLLCAGAWVSGCKKDDAPGKDAVAEQAGASAPVATRFVKVVEQKVSPRLDVSGTLDPDERSEIAAQTSGTALKVLVDIGSRVKKDDVLVELDAREASLRLSAANATTASQRARLGLKGPAKFDVESVADVKLAKESADMAGTDLERSRMLYESGAISKAQFDQAKSAKDRADSAYDAARNAVEQTWVGLVASQSQAGISSKSLDDTKIRAPFDGTIDAKKIAPGEFAAAGRVVVVLVRDNPLRFRFDVPEAQTGVIAAGSRVDIRVAAFPNQLFQGEVKRLAASVRSQTRTLPVEAEIPNADQKLRPGFFARGSVHLTGEQRTAMLVPISALLPISGGSRLFVKKGDRVEERLVVTGAQEGDLMEVSGQIAPGDEVATENLVALSDGAVLAN